MVIRWLKYKQEIDSRFLLIIVVGYHLQTKQCSQNNMVTLYNNMWV